MPTGCAATKRSTIWSTLYRQGHTGSRQEAYRTPVASKPAEKGLKALRLSDEELIGHDIAEDLVNTKTGDIYAEAGEEITGTERKDGAWDINVGKTPLKTLVELGYKELPLLNIDHVNVGAYIRNTLAIDKNMTREDALFDIYRVMRPGEPPTIDTAQICSSRCSSIGARPIRPLSAGSR